MHIPVTEAFARSDMFCCQRSSGASAAAAMGLFFLPRLLINHLISLIGPNQN